MKDNLKLVNLNSPSEWRKWLEKNHLKENGVFLIILKKYTKRSGLSYEQAVEEAICFGWIDSILKTIDDEKYALRFSPRKKGSIWSEANKNRAIEMIKQGRMVKAGFEKIEEAKANGKWDSAYSSRKKLKIPKDLKEALRKDKEVMKIFDKLPNSKKLTFVFWIEQAKHVETRKRRIKEMMRIIQKNKIISFSQT